MNSNIAFVLYNCKQNKVMPEYTMRVFHNENLIKVDGCDSLNCKVKDFIKFFKKFIDKCGSTKKVCAA